MLGKVLSERLGVAPGGTEDIPRPGLNRVLSCPLPNFSLGQEKNLTPETVGPCLGKSGSSQILMQSGLHSFGDHSRVSSHFLCSRLSLWVVRPE